MGISLYLAMTAAEIAACDPLPEKLAYMACHFSPYSTGLSNIPANLPPGSMLILNDRTPISGHDPKLICFQLCEAVEKLQCESILLDFQRPDNQEIHNLCKLLTSELPCPVGVSDLYASALSCPVFLSPCPLDTPLQQHIQPWQGREIWLDAAPEAACIRLGKQGSEYFCVPYSAPPENTYSDPGLHCSYFIEIQTKQIQFHLWRSWEQLQDLLSEADALGIGKNFGLYQQWNLETKKLPVE